MPCETLDLRADTEHDEDAGLVTAFLEGDGDALVRKYHRLVVHSFLRFSSSIRPEDAEDLAQDLWIHVRDKASALRDRRCFHSWLSTIIRRQAINFCERKHHSVPSNDGYFHERSAPDGDPAAPLLRAEQIHCIHDVLGQLSPMDREALDCSTFQRMSIREIMQTLRNEQHPDGLPEGTVKRRIHVARKRFAKAFMRRFPEMVPEVA